MVAAAHFQVHPEYTNDEGDLYAATEAGEFVVVAGDALEDDRVERRDLSDGMVLLGADEAVAADIVVSETVDPGEIPMDDMGL